jgi:putative Holliday junction resolvase
MPDPGPAKAPQIVLAFDFGLRRIGAACGDTLSRNASPLKPVDAHDGQPRWDALGKHVAEWQPDLLVVGLPYNVDGSESDGTRAAREFAAQLTARFSLKVILVDERYSSLDAQARLKAARSAGTRTRRIGKGDIDAAAACVILERFFENN